MTGSSALADALAWFNDAVVVLLVLFVLGVGSLTRDVARDLRRRPTGEEPEGSPAGAPRAESLPSPRAEGDRLP